MLRQKQLKRLFGHASHIQEQIRHSQTSSDLIKKGSSFWQNYSIRDLQDSSPEQELARRHNLSLPYVKDQLIVGKIVKVDRDHVTIHTGHKTPTAFAKKELNMSMLVKSRDLGMRTGPRDFRVGDVMHFMLEELETPFGDIGLRVPNKVPEEDKARLVWEEIVDCYRERRTVQARILNPINGGYAVGIAGIIGFLPYSQCSVITASKVGVLQDFYVVTLQKKENPSFVLTDKIMEDEKLQRQQAAIQREREEIERLKQSIEAREQEIAAKQSKVPEILKGRLTGLQYATLVDYCLLYAHEHNERPGRGVSIPLPLFKLHRLFGPNAATSTTVFKLDKQRNLVHELQIQTPGELYSLILARMTAWELDTTAEILKPKPWSKRKES